MKRKDSPLHEYVTDPEIGDLLIAAGIRTSLEGEGTYNKFTVGALLRMLPPQTFLWRETETIWMAQYFAYLSKNEINCKGQNPANAVAKLLLILLDKNLISKEIPAD